MSEARLRYLDNLVENTSYANKKSSLEKDFSKFLLNYSKTIKNAGLDDVRKFLVHKDNMGKTQIHGINCPNLGKSGIYECDCPLRLSSGTVQSIISQLKSIFKCYGRGDKWNDELMFGNPACSVKVTKYLDAIKFEQAVSHRVVKQAKPLFFEKLRKIALYIDSQLLQEGNFSKRFVLLRDQAFLKLQFFAGDRAADLGRCLSQEFKCLHNDEGFLVTHTVGKTLSNGRKNEFKVMRLDDHSVCPVFALQKYVAGVKDMGVDLSNGYLFRILGGDKKHVLESPVSHSTMYSRLELYLGVLNIDEGETPHSLRGGCAVTLAASGSEKMGEIMDHVGWFSKKSFDRYSRINRFIDNSVGNLFKEVARSPETASKAFENLGDPSKLPAAF